MEYLADLPLELLEEIARHIENPDDRRNLQTCCVDLFLRLNCRSRIQLSEAGLENRNLFMTPQKFPLTYLHLPYVTAEVLQWMIPYIPSLATLAFNRDETDGVKDASLWKNVAEAAPLMRHFAVGITTIDTFRYLSWFPMLETIYVHRSSLFSSHRIFPGTIFPLKTFAFHHGAIEALKKSILPSLERIHGERNEWVSSFDCPLSVLRFPISVMDSSGLSVLMGSLTSLDFASRMSSSSQHWESQEVAPHMVSLSIGHRVVDESSRFPLTALTLYPNLTELNLTNDYDSLTQLSELWSKKKVTWKLRKLGANLSAFTEEFVKMLPVLFGNSLEVLLIHPFRKVREAQTTLHRAVARLPLLRVFRHDGVLSTAKDGCKLLRALSKGCKGLRKLALWIDHGAFQEAKIRPMLSVQHLRLTRFCDETAAVLPIIFPNLDILRVSTDSATTVSDVTFTHLAKLSRLSVLSEKTHHTASEKDIRRRILIEGETIQSFFVAQKRTLRKVVLTNWLLYLRDFEPLSSIVLCRRLHTVELHVSGGAPKKLVELVRGLPWLVKQVINASIALDQQKSKDTVLPMQRFLKWAKL